MILHSGSENRNSAELFKQMGVTRHDLLNPGDLLRFQNLVFLKGVIFKH